MRVRVTFDEIAVTGTRRFLDPSTGKRRQISKRFYQTVNPFNIDLETGQPKTREKILQEVCRERDAWVNNESLIPPE